MGRLPRRKVSYGRIERHLLAGKHPSTLPGVRKLAPEQGGAERNEVYFIGRRWVIKECNGWLDEVPAEELAAWGIRPAWQRFVNGWLVQKRYKLITRRKWRELFGNGEEYEHGCDLDLNDGNLGLDGRGTVRAFDW